MGGQNLTLANYPSNFNHSNYQHLPPELTQSGRFCCWRYAERNGRRTKLPFNPSTGTSAKSNSPATFVDFQTAVRMSHAYDGIGIGIFDGISAIDLDHCVTDSGCLIEPAATIVELMHSYTEYSPSGDGLHILFQTDGFVYDTQRFYIMNHDHGLEVYVAGATNKYLTVTGNRANDYPFGDRSQELLQVLERFMRRPNLQKESAKNSGVNVLNGVNSTPPPLTPALPDNELLFKALNGKNSSAFAALWSGDQTGYPSQSEADFALCSKLAFWTGCDAGQMDRLFRQSGLMRPKWDRRQSGTTYGAITLQRAIESCHEVYSPRKAPVISPPQNRGENGENVQNATPPPFLSFEPLQVQASQLPPFPLHALPKPIKDYCSALSLHSQTAPDMSASIAIGTLAVCLQGKFSVEGKQGYTEPLSLYMVVIAPPGERKSAVLRSIIDPVRAYEKRKNQQLLPQIQENQAKRKVLQRKITRLEKKLERTDDPELELELRDCEHQLEDTPEQTPVRYYADDCTPEALTSLLSSNNGIFSVISSEGGIFDILAGRYSTKPNLETWLKGYCGDEIRVDRRGREPEYIAYPTLSAILAVQPTVLSEIMENSTMEGRGLLARFLYCSPPSTIGNRTFETPPIPQVVQVSYHALIEHLLDLPTPLTHEQIPLLTLSSDARQSFSRLFAQHERYLRGRGRSIPNWAAKYMGTVLRIAGLLHVAEGHTGDCISVQTLCNAIEIGSYFLAHAEFAYTQIATDQSIQQALVMVGKLQELYASGQSKVKHYDLFRSCRGRFFKTAQDIDPTLELLQEHGYLRLDEPPSTAKAGRKRGLLITLNPIAF